MENASKALIIAGGVLIAILTIAVLLFAWRTMGTTAKEDDLQKASQQLSEFNEQFTSYQKQILYGADVASVINKIRSNNSKHSDNNDYQIAWEIKLKESIPLLNVGTYNEAKYSQYENMTKNVNSFKDFKALYFRCTSIGYNSSGRVNKISFEQIKASEIFNT